MLKHIVTGHWNNDIEQVIEAHAGAILNVTSANLQHLSELDGNEQRTVVQHADRVLVILIHLV